LPLLLLAACATTSPEQRAAAAKAKFDDITSGYNNAPAVWKCPGRDEFLRGTAARYKQFLRQYRDQPFWCAQATRSLGNVRAEQGRLDDAVKLYRRVGERYPQQDWEVIQAWKSAADLLWNASRQDDARAFYRQITARFDRDDAPAIVKTIVRASKKRL